MKKSIFFTVIVAVAVASGWYITNQNDSSVVASTTNEGHEESEISKEQRIQGYLEWRTSKMLNEEGVFDPQDYYNAVAQADAIRLEQGNANKASGNLNISWDFMGPDNVGGRTRSILFDNQDASGETMFAGSVGGGLFKSTDGGRNWTRVSSYNGFQPIASIAQATDGTIYVGTGEGLSQPNATGENSGNVGNGIWKSIDGGNTWDHLASTDEFGGQLEVPSGGSRWNEVNDLAIDPENSNFIIAGANNRLMVSDDAGVSWSTINSPTGQTQAVEFATDGSIAYAALGGEVYSSTPSSNFMTWTAISAGNASRADVAIAPSNPDVVYASYTLSGGCLDDIWRTTDGGDNWTQIVSDVPSTQDPFRQVGDMTQGCPSNTGQGWYDHTIAVNPADPNKLYIGGITLYTWGSGSGGLKRADKIGSENQDVFDPQYIHADKHEIVFDPNDPTGNTMIIGNDGGMTKTTNANDGFPDNMAFREINKNYGTYQAYGMGAGRYGDVFGGAQDNGSIYVDHKGSSFAAGFEVSGGDGMYGEVSNLIPEVMFSGSQNGVIYRSIDGGASVNAFGDANIDNGGCGFIMCNAVDPNNGCPSNGSAPFVFTFYLMETSESSNPTMTGYLSITRIDTMPQDDGSVMYNVVLTNGEELLQTEALLTPGGYNVTSKTGVNYEEVLTTPLFLGDTAFFSDPYDAKYFVASTCGIWMCSNPLSKTIQPVFYKISNTGSSVTGFDSSKDGDVLYATRSGGQLLVISGFNSAESLLPAEGCDYNDNSCTNGILSVNSITIGGRLEGVSVDPNDPNHVLVAEAGFGADTKVHRSINALSGGASFTSAHGNLPNMPVYDCVIDAGNSQNYLVATELGVWSSNDQGITWTEENEDLDRVPTFRIRQEWMYEESCPVLYLGTHGRGMWASTTLTDAGCNKNYGEWPVGVGIKDIDEAVNNISIYPNPTVGLTNVKFDLDKSSNVTMRIINIMGKVVETKVYAGTVGEQQVSFDANSFANGTYMVVLTTEGKAVSSAMFIKK
ncbi:MAG: T9SS type A sorting domain-containing protein [Chitinophagales bacterium]